VSTAFVTGGTGFLGLHVVEALLSPGAEGGPWSVVALHRPGSRIARLEARGVTMVEGALEDRASLERALGAVPGRCDAVFHVAGNVAMWSRDDARQTRDNVDGTRNLVEAALVAGARRFVHTSTVAVWGRQARVPFDETAPKNGATSPINYVRSKLAGEEIARAAVARGLPAVIMNPCHIIGRYDVNGWSKTIGLVARGKLPAIPPGQGSFCDARAVARAHVTAAARGRPGENYLLGGPAHAYASLVRTIGALLPAGARVPRRVLPLGVLAAVAGAGRLLTLAGVRPPVTPEMVEGLAQDEVVDSSKAVRELGYESFESPASGGLEAMLRDALAWQIEEGLVPSPL
jgi:nucleoside-diphosphate-sugar epimerase